MLRLQLGIVFTSNLNNLLGAGPLLSVGGEWVEISKRFPSPTFSKKFSATPQNDQNIFIHTTHQLLFFYRSPLHMVGT